MKTVFSSDIPIAHELASQQIEVLGPTSLEVVGAMGAMGGTEPIFRRKWASEGRPE